MQQEKIQEDGFIIKAGEAAKILGIGRRSLSRMDIPFRQFHKRGWCYYRKADLERKKQESIHKLKQAD